MKKIWRSLIGLGVIAGVLVLISPVFTNRFRGAARQDYTRQDSAKLAIPVLTVPARTADVPVFIEGVGSGRAWNSVLVRSQVDGILQKLLFTEGQDVHRGDPLAKIDPTLYQAQLDQAIAKKAQDEAQLANARLDLQRYIGLSATNAVTKQQTDTQRATVAQQEALVKYDAAVIDSARATLGYTDIVSPIDGRTGIRNVDEGNLIHASDATGIVTVSQIQPIAVIFTVPQQQLDRINLAVAQGDLAVEALDDQGKRVIDRGTLEVIDNTIDQTTGTVRLKGRFPNDKFQIWPGAFINVRLRVETLKQAIVVPVSALQRGPKGMFVYVLHGDKVEVRNVSTGQQDEHEAVITSGLKPSEIVVTTGFAKLTDGATVSATNDDAATAVGAPALHQETGTPPPREDHRSPSQAPHQRRHGASAQMGVTQ
jgi:multidrug efflux system membrane fusion protein